jgi:tetratricopeptide (TPR) repeat protein
MDQVANPVAYYVGLSSFNLDDLPAALKAFSEAYNLYPDDYHSILNLARVKEKFNLHDDAEKLLQKGLKIYSDNPVLQKELCNVYYSRGEFIKGYITLRSIPGWEKDSILIGNIRILENKMGIAQRTAEEIHTPDFRPDESIKYYLAMITEDPSWLELIVKKAARKGKSLQKMVLIDAKYMAELQIRYYQSRIIKDPAWIELIRQKAIRKKITVDEMVRIDAEYMVSQRFNYFKSKIESDTVELAMIVKKAIRMKKSLVETIRAEAEYRIDEEIKHGK